MSPWKSCLFGGFLYSQRHAHSHDCADNRGHPKEPAPVKRWNFAHSYKCKSCQQHGANFENAKTSQVDHETVNASKFPALRFAKPCGVDLYHAWGTKGLEVA